MIAANHPLQRTGGQRWFLAQWASHTSGVVLPPPLSTERSAAVVQCLFKEGRGNTPIGQRSHHASQAHRRFPCQMPTTMYVSP
jgi:hypothetical protein